MLATIGLAYWKTKAVVPTVLAMILGGAVLWSVYNVSWFSTKVGEETSARLATVRLVVEMPAAVDAPVVIPG